MLVLFGHKVQAGKSLGTALSLIQLRQQQGKIENLPFKMDENSLVEPLVRFLVRFQSYRLQGIVVTVKNIFMD